VGRDLRAPGLTPGGSTTRPRAWKLEAIYSLFIQGIPMEATKYTCPECSTVLKVSKALAPGKKLRCPKCETLFAPTSPPAPAVKAARPRPTDDEDEEGGLYQFAGSGQPPEAKPGKKKSIYEEPLKNPFAKSKRGPAMAQVVKPSNAMLGAGLLTCVGSLAIIIYYLFPIIFSDTPLTPEELITHWVYIVAYVLVFIYAGFIIKGAVDMQNLESYNWAVAASYMALIPFTSWFWLATLPAGIWCLTTLYKQPIKEGFMEKKPE
jgi:predicted Zn finger-like uncharacterized protein